jgi:hypothetical protein
MPRFPLSSTSANWGLVIIPIVFGIVFLFNAYKLGRLKGKLTYNQQLSLTFVLILSANLASTLLKHWIYRNIGFVICGILWILHPVLPKSAVQSEKAILWTRIAGVILLLMAMFTRAY